MTIWWCAEHRCSSDQSNHKCHNAYSVNLCRLVPMQAIPVDKPFQIVFEPEEQHYYIREVTK